MLSRTQPKFDPLLQTIRIPDNIQVSTQPSLWSQVTNKQSLFQQKAIYKETNMINLKNMNI